MWMDAWIFVLIPILLIALFFYLVWRIIWAMFRGVGWLLGFGGCSRGAGRLDGPGGRTGAVIPRAGKRICHNPCCRRANERVARFCAQCGQRLEL